MGGGGGDKIVMGVTSLRKTLTGAVNMSTPP